MTIQLGFSISFYFSGMPSSGSTCKKLYCDFSFTPLGSPCSLKGGALWQHRKLLIWTDFLWGERLSEETAKELHRLQGSRIMRSLTRRWAPVKEGPTVRIFPLFGEDKEEPVCRRWRHCTVSFLPSRRFLHIYRFKSHPKQSVMQTVISNINLELLIESRSAAYKKHRFMDK